MIQRTYRLMYLFALLMAILGGVVVIKYTDSAYQALGATFAGAGLSLFVSTYVQSWASEEQSQLIRDLTLRTEGVKSLPAEFLELKWLAYASRIPDGASAKKIDWRICKLRKIGLAGESTCIYSTQTTSPSGQAVTYTCTFVGLAGRVACIIAKGRDTERTAVLILETAVSGSDVYFGPGYIVDWLSDNAFTLAIVGASECPSAMNNISATGLTAFSRWFGNTAWSVEEVFQSHRT